PDAPLTRQDLSLIFVRYAEHLGNPLPAAREYEAFADESEIAGYALDAVKALYASGVINGVGDGLFSPGGGATRAQAAAMLHRIAEVLG
ncbi:MAG: S-layer homology domain-containing protein, partial [Clostridiales bacterium]|nr:S-layer homology domain-containing protein [Clostridiales bacterium]